MTFGEKLYRLRKSQGLSQEALAEKLNTSRQAVSKWENNNGYPETEKIILISKIFQVKLDDLLLDDRAIGSDNEKKITGRNGRILCKQGNSKWLPVLLQKKIFAVGCGVWNCAGL